MSARGYRDQIATMVPPWLANRRDANVGYKLLYVLARTLDIFVQVVLEGVRAAWPGKGTPTALTLIGASRGILRGEAESDDSFAARLRAWLETWKDAGSSDVLIRSIQAYLGNTPTVRIVTRAGNWVSIDPDGTITRTKAADAAWSWDWDSASNPERAGWWSDLWIFVYPCEWTIAGTVGDTADPSHDTEAIGHLVSQTAGDAILGLVADLKGAHTWVVAIGWSYDATLFDPATVNAANPDGTWGYWTKQVGSARVPARTGVSDGKVRYWIPARGGA